MKAEYLKNRKIILIILSALISSAFFLHFFLKLSSEKIISELEKNFLRKFEAKTSRKIKKSKSVYSFNSVSLENLAITEKETEEQFFNAEKINISFDPYFIVLSKKPFIEKITIDKANIKIHKTDEKWNFQNLIEFFNSDEPLYLSYKLKTLEISDSNLLFKKNDNNFEIYFSSSEIHLNHLPGTAKFDIYLKSDIIYRIKNFSLFSKSEMNLKAVITSYIEEIETDLFLKSITADLISSEKADIYFHFKDRDTIKLKMVLNNITGYERYSFFRDIDSLYFKVFSKKLSSFINELNLYFYIDKYRSELKINMDNIINFKSSVNFTDQTDEFQIKIDMFKAESKSKMFHPDIKSNSSESINRYLSEMILKTEKTLLFINRYLINQGGGL